MKSILKTFQPMPKACKIIGKPFHLSNWTVATCLFVTLLAANLAASSPVDFDPGSNYLAKRLPDQINTEEAPVIHDMHSNYFAVPAEPAQRPSKQITPYDLRCNYFTDPIGISNTAPRLSWKIKSTENEKYQSAYQVIAASSPKLLNPGAADLWNSEKVTSSQSTLIKYEGTPLPSRQRCWWMVRTWDKNGKPSKWSEPAYFETGLNDPADWSADWMKTDIEFEEYSYPAPLFRKEFTIEKEIDHARLYVTSLGLYEFYLNGEKVGSDHFTPGWTSFQNRLLYQTYDITPLLKKEGNAAGIMLGNGWYRAFYPNNQKENDIWDLQVLAQIEITFTDGTKQVVQTGNDWKSATGPVQKSEIFYGEIYDARHEHPGWSSFGFDDRHWSGTTTTGESKAIITPPDAPPVRRINELTPIAVIITPEGDTVLDMGQNMVGRCRLIVDCPAGTTITLKHAEVLDKAGNFYTENLRRAEQEVIYICRGGGPESYEPHFTFQGFRYVKIEGYPGEVTTDLITGVVLHSDLERTGTFSCNNELINQLQHNIIWGQKGNFLDVPTDCPQRDERLGWTGDAQVFAPTAIFNMQSAGFYNEWLKDLAADQHDDGAVPHVIPNVLARGGAHGWADAAVIVPWVVYRYYGDTAILEQQYESMKRWVQFVAGEAGETYLWKPEKDRQFGDWLAFATTRSDYPGATTDKDLLASAYFYHSTDLLQQIAALLGKNDDAVQLAISRDKIKTAFNEEYVTPNGRLSSNTQTAYVVALTFGLLPEAQEERAALRLAEDVRKFGHITTGFLGTADICHVLTKYGYLEEAYQLLYRQDYPSWLYPVTRGATTIWERWDGIKPDGTFQNAGMNSFNHYAYGAIGDWLYRKVAGIDLDPEVPGFRQFIIKPHPFGEMNDVKASHISPYGEIRSEWSIKDNRLQLKVTIPVNTTAEIYVPSTGTALTVDGKELSVGEKGLSINGKKNETKTVKNAPKTDYHYLKLTMGSGTFLLETELDH